MATAGAGQFAIPTLFTHNADLGNEDIYTCPAGKWADVYLFNFNGASSTDKIQITRAITGVVSWSENATVTNAGSVKTATMGPGDILQSVSPASPAVRQYNILVLEYSRTGT